MVQNTRQSLPSTTLESATGDGIITGSNIPGSMNVNRKKAKRRAKQAARQAAEKGSKTSGYETEAHGSPSGQSDNLALTTQSRTMRQNVDYPDLDLNHEGHYDPTNGDKLYLSDDDEPEYQSYGALHGDTNGHFINDYVPSESRKKTKKKKKSKQAQNQHEANGRDLRTVVSNIPPPPPPPPASLQTASYRPAHRNAKDQIWNTSTQEERERIKDFWLSLGEEDRKSLVKIEKEAVLRKMKEQQKHTCSCTVCGRKRTAIEEELEVLYDAYYEELEQYANHQQVMDDTTFVPSIPGRFGNEKFLDRRMPPLVSSLQDHKRRVHELAEFDDGIEDQGDEEYADGYEEEESDDGSHGPLRGSAADFFTFGNSLTVKGGILTVADDLLKNDGKKFIEMMEQLAERRMQREEEAQFAANGLASSTLPNSHGHNHEPLPDDEDDFDEEEYDSQDEDYDDEDDEPDTMTEEQRMEEGRRMFQIFAARMFEQRVLTAYREKVARERQQKLLEELEEESRLDEVREAKKARDAQKKKDKKKQQQLAKAEEKARKEAEKAAEEAAAKAAEERKLEEQRKKKEEQRKKKEAERKAQEEERQKKEAEKQKRIQERERQQEAERKQREQKLAERKAREEARKKEREQKDSNDKESKEKKDKETAVKNEKESKARTRRETTSNVIKEVSNISKKRSQPTLPVTPGLSLKATSSGAPSPHVQVATPAVPKAPTPVKPRQNSQQDSHASSPKTPNAIPSSLKPISPRDGTMHQQPQLLHQQHQLSQFEVQQQQQHQPQLPQQPQPQPLLTNFKARPSLSSPQLPPNMPPLHHPQPSSPIQLISPLPTTGAQASMPTGLSSLHAGLNAQLNQGPYMQHTAHQPPLGVNPVPLFPQQAPMTSQFRAFPGQASMTNQHSNISAYGMIPHNRGFPLDGQPALSPTSQGAGIGSMMPGFGITRDTMPSHSRQHSGSLDKAPFDPIPAAPPTQPIARPAPIQRPPSAKSQEGRHDSKGMPLSDMDDLSNHLGSSALLADADDTIPIGDMGPRRAASLAAPPKATGLGFASSPMFPEPVGQRRVESFSRGASGVPGMNWNTHTPVLPFSSTAALSPAPNWGTPGTASGWSNANAFGMPGTQTRGSISRPVSLRLMVCQACKQLSATDSNSNGFHELRDILNELNTVRPSNDVPAHVDEMMEIFETEGNSHNGGGYFLIKKEGPDRTLVKYEADGKIPPSGMASSAIGEIGSPLPGHSMPSFGGGQRLMHPVGTAPQGF